MYRIKAIGSGFEVGTDEQPVLVCRSLKIARRAVADAQRLALLPPRPIPWRVPPEGKLANLDVEDVAGQDERGLEILVVADGPPLCG
ncbi:conserved hypothetical protein [Bradyrhizobium sp. ORS 375]|nr:conserved hypothetical protein [Bradyrhizobium sp. ORS 375]